MAKRHRKTKTPRWVKIAGLVLLIIAGIGSCNSTESRPTATPEPVRAAVETENPAPTPAPTDVPEPTETPEPTPTPDLRRDYVLNTSTHRFHDPGCSSVEDIKPGNRKDYRGTAEELEARGYKPCGRCNP